MCSEFLTGLQQIEPARCDFVLSKSELIGLIGISPNQKQHELHSQLLNLNYFRWKITKKVLKVANWWLKQISKFQSLGSFMKKVTKFPFSFPVY